MVVTAQSFPPLPDICLISMRVHYSDQCPEDFLSDGFIPSESGDGFILEPEKRLRFDIGGVATHHDALKFTLCTRNDESSDPRQQQITPKASSDPKRESEIRPKAKGRNTVAVKRDHATRFGFDDDGLEANAGQSV